MAVLVQEPKDELVKKLTDGFEALLAQAVTLATRNSLLQDKAAQFQDQVWSCVFHLHSTLKLPYDEIS